MSRSLTLTRAAQNPGTDYSSLGYRIVVTASNPTNVSTGIFRYTRRYVDPLDTDGDTVDIYSGLCTAMEMSSLPLNNPDPEVESGFFRKATADVIFAGEDEAADFWTLLKNDTLLLLQTLDLMDVLSSQEVYVVSTA